MKSPQLEARTAPPGRSRLMGLTTGVALLLSGGLSAQTYCPSDGGSGNTFNIARVQFNGIDNVSGDNNGYGDFTAQVANVDPGASYGITVDPSGPFFLRYRWRAWVDWNNDGTFSGAELVFQTTGFGQETGTVSVPAGTAPGAKRMRVNMSAFTYQGACANYSVGEVEDYTVLVSAPCDVTAGTLVIDKPVICYEGGPAGVTAQVASAPTVPDGYQIIYVLTQGPGLVIIDASPTPSFSLPVVGEYTIHTLVYDPNTLDLGIVEFGVTTGFQVNSLLVQGGGSICAALDVAGAQARVIDPQAGTLSGGGTVCGPLPATLTATPNGDVNIPAGFQALFVLTQGEGLVIQNVSTSPSFEVNDGGLYTIHTLVYDPSTLDLSGVEIGVTTGFDVNGFLIQGGGSICAALDVAGAAFNVADANAGTLSGGSDVCLSGAEAVLTATANGDSNTPAGYSLAYVLTSGTNLVIEQLGAAPSFTVTSGGLYTIHTFVFPSDLDLSVVVPGTTTGGDVLALLAANNICASLDVAGAAFNVADPNAGTLSGGSDICLSGAEAVLTATANGDSNTPAGYSLAYVLTSGTELTIQQLGAAPSFTVTSGGLYTIHTFVFPSDLDLSVVVPGTTTGGDVLALLAANNICASLDVAGAAFNVADPNAGTLSGGSDVCLSGAEAVLTATANGDSNTPAGYSLAYVLTSGTELTIEQLGAAPSFTVTSGGLYTIHTFVFPSDLDLSVVVPGTTTGGDVLALLAANNICASLDVAGAAFNVADPNAGTLSGGSDVCLSGAEAVLTATANGDSNTPAGYSLAYVLTSGTNLVIEQLGAAPSFTVTSGGLYTIHTFVFPSDLDLSVVVPGTTTGGDVLALLAANNICASLDVAGAAFNVSDPNAGTLSGGSDVCLSGTEAVLTATPNGDSNTPAGYSLAYVLTSGTDLVIEQLGAAPSFTVTSGGLYTIHTFVFPSDLDLSVVVPGTTTGGDVLALLAANNICASLDVAGAAFNVADPNAGTLSGGSDVCLSGAEAVLTATPNGDSNTPAGYSLAYVLTSGTDLVIEQLGAAPSFTVTSGGLYTIHTFVFPSDLDLSVVVPGTTTGGDVLALLAANNICASLDVAGAAFNVADPNAGTLSGGSDVCLSGAEAVLTATPNGDSNTPAGYSLAYVLTSGTELTIQQLGAAPSFTVTSGGLYTIHTFVFPSDLDLSVVVPGTTTGGDVLALLAANNICASLDVAGAAFNVADPNAGTLSGGSDVCLSGAEAVLTATPNGDSNTPAGYSLAYVLTSGTELTIQQLGAAPSFTVTSGGLYTIHTFVFPSDLDLSVVVPGTTTGGDVLALLAANNICASLDVAGAAFNVADPNAGTLSGGSDVCLSGAEAVLTATPNGDSNTPAGYSLAYVLTSGTNLVIEQLGAAPSFTVTSGGLYTIHTFVFPSDLDLSVVVPGTTTGGDVLALLAANNICASLDVAGAAFNVSDPNAGTLSGGSDVCLSGAEAVLTATPNGDSNTPAGYSLAYVLTSGTELTIQQLGAAPSFTVTSGGLYTIHTFVFPSDLDLSVVVPGTTTGGDVLALLAANNICASLDVAGAAFNVSDPNAGTLSGGSDVCLSGAEVVLTATANGDSNTPAGYSLVYVLTSGTELTIEQLGAAPSFTVTSGGLYTIHTFVFPSDLDLSVVVPGTTTGGDVLALLAANNICASLDVAGAAFNVSDPNAGTLSGGSDVCLSGAEAVLTATSNGDSNTPAGYSLAYVLTSGTNLVIEQLGAAPSFTVTSGGLYTIHTFVFPSDLDLSVVVPGTTTGGDVLALLAANNICASLDVAGAAFNVAAPNAGTLTSDDEEVCLPVGTLTLTATPNGDLVVPNGYSVLYVLTEGAGLVLQAAGAEPNFVVSALGNYTIHTLVYDPATLDLSGVVFGETTGFDVNALLVQGGGSICGSLDVAGAQTTVVECPLECLADAGTLSGGGDVCLSGDAVTLSATANGDSNTPAGFSLAYVLTSGAELTIQQLGAAPSFEVNNGGLYTIHTFVFPSDLDLSVVVPGVTTGGDVLALLEANDICASLDVAGAAFNVTNPDAGTLSGGGDVCLTTDAVTLTATANGDSNTPAGYSLAYVLTSGAELTIQQLGAAPSFDVTNAGLYTIHTFVFPSDLDLSVVVPGVTTGGDVLALLAANNICASLDVAGAAFQVAECPTECIADAGDITPSDFVVCRQGGSATVVGVPAGNDVVPAGYQTLYVLTRGQGLVIRAVSSTPAFVVGQLGLWRIHTLVYDPATLDLSGVVFGQTTGFDVNGLLIQGGGEICASLDVQGAPFIVVGPFLCNILGGFNNGLAPQDPADLSEVLNGMGLNIDSEEQLLSTIENDAPMSIMNVFPNPTRDIINLDLMVVVDTELELSILNALGQEAMPGTSLNVGQGANRSTLDISTLPAGPYLIRLTTMDKVVTHRFTKVD